MTRTDKLVLALVVCLALLIGVVAFFTLQLHHETHQCIDRQGRTVLHPIHRTICVN